MFSYGFRDWAKDWLSQASRAHFGLCVSILFEFFSTSMYYFFFFTISTFFIVIKYNNIKFTILALFKAPVQ